MSKAKVFFVTRDRDGKVTTRELKQLAFKRKPEKSPWWVYNRDHAEPKAA